MEKGVTEGSSTQGIKEKTDSKPQHPKTSTTPDPKTTLLKTPKSLKKKSHSQERRERSSKSNRKISKLIILGFFWVITGD